MTTTITTAQQSDILTGTMNQLGDTFTVACLGTVSAVGLQFSGTWVATLLWEATADGITWLPLTGTTLTGVASTNQAGTGNVVVLPTAGLQAVRVRVSAYTSGTIGVTAIVNGGWFPAAATQTVAGSVTAIPAIASVTSYILNSLATVNNGLVITAAHSVMALNVTNNGAAVRYFKLYNKATAPVLATDVPVLTIPIAAGAFISLNTGPAGMRFSLGIGIAITGAAADTDTTAIGAGEVKVKIDYI